jgi:hypothetical protein
MLLYGNGMISGATSLSLTGDLAVSGKANITQGLTTASRGINNASVPAGGIIQVVTSYDSGLSTTSVGWTATGLGVNITPTSSTSKILIMCSWTARSSGNRMGHRIMRTTDNVVVEGQTESLGVYNAPQRMFTHVIDSPATTSTRNYRLDIYLPSAGTIQTNDSGGNLGPNSLNQITVMEIAQ